MSCKLTSSLPFLQYVTIRVHIRCQGNGYRIMISSMFSSLATQHVGIFKQQATTCTHTSLHAPTKLSSHTTISASDITLCSWNAILNQTKQFMCSFIPIVYPCCALSAAGHFLLHPPCLFLLPFSPSTKRWVALSPHTPICFVESPRDTLAYLSSATQTSKSVLASQRDGEAPPGSRRRLQSTRCSPGIKYPFR